MKAFRLGYLGVVPFVTSMNLSALELKTDTDKASYAVGQQIGKSLKNQGVDLNMAVLNESLKDAFTGKPSALKDEELTAALKTLHQKAETHRQAEATANLEKGKKFLAENGVKKDVKTTPSGLQYRIITEGKGDSPKDESVVKVHYKGNLINGEEFDSSYGRGTPAEFPVNGVIKGWTEALKMMKPGAKWALTIPANLAYGEMGRPSIPANSVLNFEVELIDIVKK